MIALALGLAPGVAHADATFEESAAQARRVAHLDESLWAATTACDKGDDTQQRQCRRVRDVTHKAFAGATLLVDGEPEALELGGWNAAKKSLAVRLTGCVRCTPIDVDGKKLRVVPAKAGALYDNAKAFPDEASAVAWAKLARTHRVELIVKLPDKKWPVTGGNVAIEVIGFRAIAACDGSVIVASPPSGPAARDPKACAAP